MIYNSLIITICKQFVIGLFISPFGRYSIMKFGEAIEIIKEHEGKSMYRTAWHGIQSGGLMRVSFIKVVTVNRIDDHNLYIGDVFIVSINDKKSIWHPSQPDMVANDWVVVGQ